MYPVAKGCHHGRGQRSRNVVVKLFGGSVAPPSLACLGAILLMGRDSHGRFLLKLAIWRLTFSWANTYLHDEALSHLCL
jgi:hypothetical protein